MTDEQLREQFKKWSQQDAPPWSPADTPYSFAFAAWRARDAMWDGYRARDAEVQALREALDEVLAAAKAALSVLRGDPVQWCQSETTALAAAVARAEVEQVPK